VPDARPRPRAWLIWNDRAFALDGQRAEIGRDPGCAIWIDAPGVSRRHAAIDWRADRPMLTDLDSTNGTVVEGRRIEDATPLAEGQTIAIGDATLIFRTAAAMDAPTKKIRKR
jgi:pSer/pThr/pTyr-binding forkhead associated (FHA) protein